MGHEGRRLTRLQSGGRGTEEQYLGDRWLLTEWMTFCRPRGCTEMGGWGAQVVRKLSGSGQEARDCGKCWRHLKSTQPVKETSALRILSFEGLFLAAMHSYFLCLLSVSQPICLCTPDQWKIKALGNFLLRSCTRDEGFWLMQSWWLFLSL